MTTDLRFTLDRVVGRPLLLTPTKAKEILYVLAQRRGQTLVVNGEVIRAEHDPGRSAQHPQDRKLFHFDPKTGIATVEAVGTLVHRFGHLNPTSGMTGYDGIETQMLAAMDDPDVKGIAFDADTPGGDVSGCFDLARRFLEWRQHKPIIAVLNDMACSAGYALASCCSEIYIPDTGTAGSIGVVMMHVDHSEALAQFGMKVTLIHAGEHKVDGNCFETLPKDVRQAFQEECDSLRQTFAELVSSGRQNLSVEQILATEARCYTGHHAVDVGLADAVASPHSILQRFAARLAAPPNHTVNRGASAMSMTAEENPDPAPPTTEDSETTRDDVAPEEGPR